MKVAVTLYFDDDDRKVISARMTSGDDLSPANRYTIKSWIENVVQADLDESHNTYDSYVIDPNR